MTIDKTVRMNGIFSEMHFEFVRSTNSLQKSHLERGGTVYIYILTKPCVCYITVTGCCICLVIYGVRIPGGIPGGILTP